MCIKALPDLSGIIVPQLRFNAAILGIQSQNISSCRRISIDHVCLERFPEVSRDLLFAVKGSLTSRSFLDQMKLGSESATGKSGHLPMRIKVTARCHLPGFDVGALSIAEASVIPRL